MTQIAKGCEEDLGNGKMRITRISIISKQERSFIFPITSQEFSAWCQGALIQEAMPRLLPWQREFLLTGITDEEWNETFPPEENGEI